MTYLFTHHDYLHLPAISGLLALQFSLLTKRNFEEPMI